MSNRNSHLCEFLETWFYRFLKQGFTEQEAKKLAEKKLENTPTPWE